MFNWLIKNTFSKMQKCKIGVVQLNCGNDKSRNFEIVHKFLVKAVEAEAKFIFLPENADFIGSSSDEVTNLVEEIDGELIKKYCGFASKNGVWLSIGSMHLKKDGKIFNSHIIVDDIGKIKCVYDKVHLFDSNVPINSDSTCTMESKYIEPGKFGPCFVQNTPCGNLGIEICFDLRFPELSSANRYIGESDVLVFPSAYSCITGEAGHWEVLLRARAIENQTYVIAAAQVGAHNEKRSSYGHSMVVDPWGKIICQANGKDAELLVCDIFGDMVDPSGHAKSINQVRNCIPMERLRRCDLDYSQVDVGLSIPIPNEDHIFGPNIIKASCIFYRTKSTFAFVNLSPLVPGHVLVSPIREVERFDDLSMGELTDLYATVKKINKKICIHYNATSLTVSIQDGKDAGQSVPHVHVHVLPRKLGDFEKNDDIYSKLQEHDKIETRVKRSLPEMSTEAAVLRNLFYS